MRAYQTPTAPEGALRCRAVASGLQDRSAGCISALDESGRNLWMRPPEVKDAELCGDRLLRPWSRLLADPSSVTLDARTRKLPAGNGRTAHANHAGAVHRVCSDRHFGRSGMVAAVDCGLSQPSG